MRFWVPMPMISTRRALYSEDDGWIIDFLREGALKSTVLGLPLAHSLPIWLTNRTSGLAFPRNRPREMAKKRFANVSAIISTPRYKVLWVDGPHYRVGKLAFSFPCTVHAPLGVSMALDRAWIVKCKFTQCVGSHSKKNTIL